MIASPGVAYTLIVAVRYDLVTNGMEEGEAFTGLEVTCWQCIIGECLFQCLQFGFRHVTCYTVFCLIPNFSPTSCSCTSDTS